MKKITLMIGAALSLGAGAALAQTGSSDADVAHVLKESFQAKGIATLDRLDQTEMQKLCTQYATRPMPEATARKIEATQMAEVRFPADGQYLGNWQQGEKIAQNGRGLQFSDKAGAANGGNCYACHQLTKAEISFGNIGPSLYHYGKVRGASPEVVKYTWAKIYDSHAYAACSNMPRFGAANILTEQQMKDVMALLLDPASPVNQ